MKGFKIALWLAFTLAFLVTAIALIGQNQEPITVEIFNYVTPTYPKWVILLGCVFAGAIISSLFFLFELVILETRNVRLRRQTQRLERALSAASQSSAPNGNVANVSVSAPAVRVVGEPSLIDDSDV